MSRRQPPAGVDAEFWFSLPSDVQDEVAASVAQGTQAGPPSLPRPSRASKDPVVLDDSDDDVMIISETRSAASVPKRQQHREDLDTESGRLARELQAEEMVRAGLGVKHAQLDYETVLFDDPPPPPGPSNLDWFHGLQNRRTAPSSSKKPTAKAPTRKRKRAPSPKVVVDSDSETGDESTPVVRWKFDKGKQRAPQVASDRDSGTDSDDGGNVTGNDDDEQRWMVTRLDENSVFIPKDSRIGIEDHTLGDTAPAAETTEPGKPKGSPSKITDFFAKPNAAGSSSFGVVPSANPLPVGQLFRDPDFPPDVSSIDGNKEAANVKKITGQTLSGETITETVAGDGPNKTFYCKCGKPTRLRTVHKANENQGRSFWSCSLPRGQQCDFFMWASGKAAASHSARDLKYEWKRLGRAQGFTLVHGAFDADDVLQGAVGDCWFMAALSVLAQRPDLVSRLFVDLGKPDIGADGRYRIRLFMDGQWKLYSVDDIFPHRPEGDEKSGERAVKSTREQSGAPKLAFAKSSRKPGGRGWQIWCPLVEKAYAKANGSYRSINGGWVAEGLHDLTGFPTEVISFNHRNFDSELLWARLLAFIDSGLLVGAACMKSGDGLVGMHAYSVLDARDVFGHQVGRQSKLTDFFGGLGKTLDGKAQPIEARGGPGHVEGGLRLVRVRNPWGCHPWTGAWSRKSELWTPKLKAELGFTEKDDGTFWMSYEDFITRFMSIDILHCHSKWFSGHKQLVIPQGKSVSDRALEVRVTEPTWLYLSILQPGKRGRAGEKYWYSDVSILVIRQHGADFTVVEDIRLSAPRRSAHLELMLDDPKATYHLFFFSISREIGLRDKAVMTPARKRVVKLDQDVNLIARVFANKPLSMRLSRSFDGVWNAGETKGPASKKAASSGVVEPARKFFDDFFATILSAIISAAGDKGQRLQGFSSMGQPARVDTRILRENVRLDIYEAAGMGIAVVENRNPIRGVRLRFMLHAGDEDATNLLQPKKATRKAKAPQQQAQQEPGGGYRLDGQTVGGANAASASTNASFDCDADAVDDDGRRWEYVGPRMRSVVAAVPMPQAYEEEMLGHSMFALDRLEFETWELGAKDFDDALDVCRRRSFWSNI